MLSQELLKLARQRRPGWCKRLGEIAESIFLAKASSLGFGVAKPWGDSERYDFILDSGARLWRVQMKSAYTATADGGYSINTHGNNVRPYTARDVDVLVAYVVPADAWYVIPVLGSLGTTRLKLNPNCHRGWSRLERFRERWCVMACHQTPRKKSIPVPRACEGSGERQCPLGQLKEGRI